MAPRAEDQNGNITVPAKNKLVDVSKFKFIREGDFKIVVENAAVFLIGHVFIFVSIFFLFQCSALTIFWNIFLIVWSGLGVTCGAHRLWSHRSYKAKLPLRLFLALGQSIAGQNCLYIWCRDHRVHHKYSDTDADPHNIKRGVFFSHVGWLLYKKHPEVIEKGKKLDMDDLLADPVVYYQQVFYYPIYVMLALFLPVIVPYWAWSESIVTSFFVCFVFRQGFVLHCTWFVNSAAHLWGDKPYDLGIPPSENVWVSLVSLGEGYHNYHHTFPYDYSTSELPVGANVSKKFIDLMHRWGQAYDLKRASNVSVESRKDKSLAACKGQ